MHLQKILSSALLSLIVFTMSAQYNVSKDAALQKAVGFFNDNQGVKTRAGAPLPSSSYRLAHTAILDGEECYYVFNRGNSQGFIIISADERTSSEVLGYSTIGSFDYESMPDNAKAWVDGYAKSIKQIKETGVAQEKMPMTRSADVKPEVAPLLGDIAWKQRAPFNDLCPVDEGIKCPTGCVATMPLRNFVGRKIILSVVFKQSSLQ